MTRALAAALVALTPLAVACSDSGEDGSGRRTTPPAGSTPTSAAPEAPVLGAWHRLVAGTGGDVLLVNGYPEDDTEPAPLTLWTWDGDRWTALEPSGAQPAARNFAGVAWDDVRDELVVYGGLTPDGPSDETWTWDGDTWTLDPATGPGARSSSSLAFDTPSGRVLLYGGDDGASQYGDTWAWDGSTWTRVARDGPSPVRWPAFFEQDPTSGSPVLYGGHQVVDEDGPPAVGGTWVWDEDQWRAVPGAGQPGPLVNANGVVHPDHGLLLVGGSDFETENGRVWRWTGAAWRLLAEDVMPPRQAFGLAYDPRRGVTVLTGGLVEPGSVERRQDVWEWASDPGVPATQVFETVE